GASGDFVGTDAITTGIIYDTAAVTLVYSDILVFEEASAAATFALAEVLNPFASADDQVGDFQRNRPAVAATFEDNETGEYFTVVSVHFKSKGDSNLEDLIFDAQNASQGAGVADQADIDALLADPNYDQGDGQAFWNQAREDAADELNIWITGEYLAAAQAVEAGVGDQVLILGDFNAYAEEDPTQVFDEDEDYTDILDTFTDGGQAEAYSFVFDGQQGALDQAFATDTLAGKVTDAFEWHVNADEPDLLNYDESFNDPGFYDDGLFGASDHDPLIIGLDFGADSIV
ncbi:MAG: endonuclease/exonuclease/phosphatase family protein, partial [Pseudomonadota bacterium]